MWAVNKQHFLYVSMYDTCKSSPWSKTCLYGSKCLALEGHGAAETSAVFSRLCPEFLPFVVCQKVRWDRMSGTVERHPPRPSSHCVGTSERLMVAVFSHCRSPPVVCEVAGPGHQCPPSWAQGTAQQQWAKEELSTSGASGHLPVHGCLEQRLSPGG